MKYAFVGRTQRSLASGRPLVFGDAVDSNDLTPEDDLLKLDLVEFTEPAVAPAPVPETASADAWALVAELAAEHNNSEQKA